MSREVLTFQLGHLSNFVGTHWWNLQEASFVYEGGEASAQKSEINHDVTFREGCNLKGDVTYTPRLIAVDLGDAIHNLKRDGVLYDIEGEGEGISWSHEVTLHKEDKSRKKNEFLRDLDILEDPEKAKQYEIGECSSREEMEIQEKEEEQIEEISASSLVNKLYNLDDVVVSWTDYLRPHLHPNTLSVIKNHYQSDNSFNIHGYGSTVYQDKMRDLRSEMDDRIHFFTEESDHLQGFHLIADIYDGFGGLSSAVASDLSDDFSKKGFLAFCPFQNIRDNQDNSQTLHDLINTVQSIVKLSRFGFTVVPLSLVVNPWKSSHVVHTQLPGVTYNSKLLYHTSAVLAAAVDTCTLSHRQLRGSLPLAHLTDTLSETHRTISDLSLALPLHLDNKRQIGSDLLSSDRAPWTSLTPLFDVNQSHKANSQSLVCRGAVRCQGEILRDSTFKWSQCYTSAITEIQQPCNVKAPYPHIFDSSIDEFGCSVTKPRSKNTAVQNVAAMTSLSTTDHSHAMLSHLLERSEKLTQRHLHKHTEAGLEMEDWNDMINELRELTKRYDNSEPADSDSDSD